MRVVLGSSSKRRQDFMKGLGFEFETRVKETDESYPSGLKGSEITDYVAKKKAEALMDTLGEDELLITSDTLVILGEEVMGKPKNYEEAFGMLRMLSGREHSVITSVCISLKNNQKIIHSTTKVVFRELRDEEIRYYIEKYQPYDKAGGYGIQEWIGDVGITRIEGDYNNVVGMPTNLVYEELIRNGVKLS